MEGPQDIKPAEEPRPPGGDGGGSQMHDVEEFQDAVFALRRDARGVKIVGVGFAHRYPAGAQDPPEHQRRRRMGHQGHLLQEPGAPKGNDRSGEVFDVCPSPSPNPQEMRGGICRRPVDLRRSGRGEVNLRAVPGYDLGLEPVPLNDATGDGDDVNRSEEHTSELQSRLHLVCRLLLEKKKTSHKLTWSDTATRTRLCRLLYAA